MTDAALARIQHLAHAMCCRDRLSPKQASQPLSAYQVALDAAAVSQVLAGSRCDRCAAVPELAQPQPGTERAHVHQATASGSLTSGWPFSG